MNSGPPAPEEEALRKERLRGSASCRTKLQRGKKWWKESRTLARSIQNLEAGERYPKKKAPWFRGAKDAGGTKDRSRGIKTCGIDLKQERG